MDAIKQAKHWIANSQRLAVLTGAGISAESGVPTFRGQDGLWRNYRAEELATPEAFANDPRLVWQWYDWRRGLVAQCDPNPGHHALVNLAATTPLTLVTQNVDGLHALAGSDDLVEMHGNIWKVRCTDCQQVSPDRRLPIPILPMCDACSGLLRPHIVWFGEGLDIAVLDRAVGAFEYCDVALIIGTSGVVQPAASLGGMAKRGGAKVIEINLEITPLSPIADLSLHGPAGEILPQLITT